MDKVFSGPAPEYQPRSFSLTPFPLLCHRKAAHYLRPQRPPALKFKNAA